MPSLISSLEITGQPTAWARVRARVVLPDPPGPLTTTRRGLPIRHSLSHDGASTNGTSNAAIGLDPRLELRSGQALKLRSYDVAVNWGTVGAIALGAAVSLLSTILLRRWEWRREQRVKIHMEALPAVRREISRLQIGVNDPIVDPGQLAASTARDLCTIAIITSGPDRRLALSIADAAAEVEAIGGRYDWHGTPPPTLDERRLHGPEQQAAVALMDESTAAYEEWLERRLRFGR